MDENFIDKDSRTASEISVYQLVNILSDAAFICDQNGQVIAYSKQVFPFFGLSNKSRIIGSNFQSYIAYECVDEAYFILLSVVNQAYRQKTDNFLVKNGLNATFSAQVTFAFIETENNKGKYVLVTFRESDISDPGIELLHKKDVRLSRLFETIVSRAAKHSEKVQKLLSQIGETLGAIACSYNQIENRQLHTVSSWESPFNPGIAPQLGRKQLFDQLSVKKEKYVLVQKPLLATFLGSEAADSDESVVKAILGVLILKNEVVEGLLTVVFTFDYSFPDIDRQLIDTISELLEDERTEEPASGASQEYTFRQLIDCFTDPVYIISADGLIMDVNKGATKFYGYEREELIGQSLQLLSAEGKNDEDKVAFLFKAAYKGEPQKIEWWGRRKNGDVFPKEMMFNKSKYYNRDVVIAVGRDLSESKKVEEELLRYNKELEESNVSKDKFFSILAHDLKNPFQGLLGFIDLLYEDLDELTNAQVKEYLANVRNASYHTYALLENLLEWSRIQSGKMPFTPSVFDISEEVTSVISVLENNATQKDIKLYNEVDAGLLVEADRNMIRSVLQNLITNSIKFSNSKGKVIVRSRVPVETQELSNEPEADSRLFLEISIADNGIGIPEEILPKLFKLNGQYSQAGTANEPGTGLGLVLCYEMVGKNGGQIWAESVAGKGTTFIFTLPFVK